MSGAWLWGGGLGFGYFGTAARFRAPDSPGRDRKGHSARLFGVVSPPVRVGSVPVSTAVRSSISIRIRRALADPTRGTGNCRRVEPWTMVRKGKAEGEKNSPQLV